MYPRNNHGTAAQIFIAALLAAQLLACLGCAEVLGGSTMTAAFVDQSAARLEIPRDQTDALATIIARAPSRQIEAGASIPPPIGTIIVDRAGTQSAYEFHGSFILLRPTAAASGGVWEDPLFARWAESYRAANYHVRPEMFVPRQQ